MRTVDRILAISDIHGENKRLLSLLRKTEYDPERDLLVICGDIVDRGKENLETIITCEQLRKKGAVLLKGNHEQFTEQCLHEMISSDDWRDNNKPSENLYNWITYNGGSNFYDEIEKLSKAQLQKLQRFVLSLPLYFTIGNFIFTHAGANVKKPIEDNIENETVWMNKSFPYCPAYLGKLIVFGHVPTWQLHSYNKKNKKENTTIWYDKLNKDKIGIDCGGVFGGRLAAIELPSYREFYV